MISSVIYDGNDFPIRLCDDGDMLADNNWTFEFYRDEDSYVTVPKSSFTPDNDGSYKYTISKNVLKNLAKGLYSFRIELGGRVLNISNAVTLRKKTRTS